MEYGLDKVRYLDYRRQKGRVVGWLLNDDEEDDDDDDRETGES